MGAAFREMNSAGKSRNAEVTIHVDVTRCNRFYAPVYLKKHLGAAELQFEEAKWLKT